MGGNLEGAISTERVIAARDDDEFGESKLACEVLPNSEGAYRIVFTKEQGRRNSCSSTPSPGAKEWPNLEQLWLDVTTTNVPARTLYLSCGFHVIGLGRRALRVGDRYYDEEMMGLDLR
jgi:hypothetical protein